MGSYSVLTIDRVGFAWKYEVPTFLTLVFSDDDFYFAVPPDPESHDEYRRWIGYRTSIAEARDRLDGLGYTMPFFASLYETLTDSIDESLLEAVAEKLPPHGGEAGFDVESLADSSDEDDSWRSRARASAFLREAANAPLAEQIAAFVAVLGDALRADPRPRFIEAYPTRFQHSGEELMIKASEISIDLLDRLGTIPPAALRVSEIFAAWSDCPVEIQDLFLARVLFEILPDEGEVDLDLTDLWDDDDLSGEPSRLAQQLVRRVQLYNRAFAVLVENQDDIRRRAALARVRDLLRGLPDSKTNEEKGRQLEDLVATLFEAHPGFVVAARRYDLADQEIDLVIRNHVDNPFWSALQSPLVLVECKNWSSPVGTAEIRDFESKLRDHPMARLGLFVAINGFSSQVPAALNRAGREPYRIVGITHHDIAQLVEEDLDVLEWLARMIAALN
jgi:hypothetical protein